MGKPTKAKPAAINANWFRDALKDIGKTQADLARHLGIEASQVSKLLAGGRRVQLDEVEKIAIFLGKSNAEVLHNLGVDLKGGGAGGPPTRQDIPVVGHISADGTVEMDIEKPTRVVSAPGSVPPGTVAIAGNGSSQHMASTLLVGGLFFVQMTDRLEPSAVGHLSLVRLHKGPWMLRTIKPAPEVGMYDLVGPAGTLQSQSIVAGSPILMIRP